MYLGAWYDPILAPIETAAGNAVQAGARAVQGAETAASNLIFGPSTPAAPRPQVGAPSAPPPTSPRASFAASATAQPPINTVSPYPYDTQTIIGSRDYEYLPRSTAPTPTDVMRGKTPAPASVAAMPAFPSRTVLYVGAALAVAAVAWLAMRKRA